MAPHSPLSSSFSPSSSTSDLSSTMSSPDASWLSVLSRRKLQSTLHENSSRDNLSLHRWVLLKNFASHAESPPASAQPTPASFAEPPLEEEVFIFPDWDIFVFPDAASILDDGDRASAEAAWLDALLEELDDDTDAASELSVGDDDAAACPFPVSPASCSAAPPPPAHLDHRATPLEAPLILADFPHLSCVPLASSASSPLPFLAPSTPAPSPAASCSDEGYPFPSTPELSSAGSDAGGDDEQSDTESEGPRTPLFLSATGTRLPTPLVDVVTPDSYFVYPLEPRPISPADHAPLYIQDC